MWTSRAVTLPLILSARGLVVLRWTTAAILALFGLVDLWWLQATGVMFRLSSFLVAYRLIFHAEKEMDKMTYSFII